MIRFRHASEADVPAVVSLLADDDLGSGKPGPEMAAYLAAFGQMQAAGNNHLIIAEEDGRIIATYQIAFIFGLSLKAPVRAQLESVRVASDRRGRGIGARVMADAEARARAAGCRLIQLSTNRTRLDAHRFYDRLGFTPSHIGYKRDLT